MASYAVAFAGTGEIDRAVELAASAERMSRAIEITASAPCALAIAALRSGDSDAALNQARRALANVTRCGMIECFVSAYRGCPELILRLLEDRKVQSDVERILTVAGDASLAAHGTQPPRGSILSLSPREKEVLSLIARGMTNADIAKHLVISHVTVKVHVKHIFEKLGVRSRAEAALRAGQLGRD
jgi:DNA-binding NarL/FixJ family response regulator